MKKKTIIIISIIILTISTILLLHQKESYSTKNNTEKTYLVKEILNQNTIINDSNEVGLYSDSNNNYYFKGNVINNYLKINDNYWQIISIDNQNNIKIIKVEPINKIKYQINTDYLNYNYLNSNIYQELINYYNNDLQNIKSIIKQNYCIEYKETCLKYQEDYISLINEKELMDTFIKENNLSFIKSTDFWIMSNTYLDQEINQAYFGYLNNNGLLDETIVDDEKYLIPVVTLDKNTTITGEGTIKKPYLITE